MSDGLTRQNGNMHAPEHDRDAALPEMPRDVIRGAGATGDDTDANQVGRIIERNAIHAAVHNFHLDVRFVRQKRCQEIESATSRHSGSKPRR